MWETWAPLIFLAVPSPLFSGNISSSHFPTMALEQHFTRTFCTDGNTQPWPSKTMACSIMWRMLSARAVANGPALGKTAWSPLPWHRRFQGDQRVQHCSVPGYGLVQLFPLFCVAYALNPCPISHFPPPHPSVSVPPAANVLRTLLCVWKLGRKWQGPPVQVWCSNVPVTVSCHCLDCFTNVRGHCLPVIRKLKNMSVFLIATLPFPQETH